MMYRLLGTTGVFVSEVCLGAMTFGGRGGIWDVIGGLDQATVDTLVGRSLDAGVNFIDTADVYSGGESETMVGKALGARRHQVVLATKVRGRTGGGPNDVGLSRLHIVQALEASLARLGTDYIDLYQVHRLDALTSIEDTLRALTDLVRAGKVRYLSLVGREIEREMIPLVRDQGLGLLAWSPLAGGLLSGKITKEDGPKDARRSSFDFPPVDREKAFAILAAVRGIADRHEVSAARVALAWVLAQDVVTSVIIGARSLDQLADNLGAADLKLSEDDLRVLDEASRLAPEYPAWMESLPSDRRPGEERRFERRDS
jgi:aryl-alcohol dehydrogenase-like predicted oxidoreductase